MDELIKYENKEMSKRVDPLNPALYEYRIYSKRNKGFDNFSMIDANELIKLPGVINLIKEITKKTGTEFIAQLTEEETRKLSLGIYKMAGKKGLLAQLRDGETGEIIKQIRLQEKHIPNESIKAVSDFSSQVQMQQIASLMQQVSNGISSIQQGQRNDRIGLFYSARQKYIESLLLQNGSLKNAMFQSAISTATDAKMQMITTIFSDLDELANNKKLKKKEKDELQYQIYTALECINDCTLISALSYLELNEEQPCLSALKSYQSFVKQAFLEKHESGMTYAEILHDNLKINDDIWLKKPNELIDKVSKTINNINNKLIPFDNILALNESADAAYAIEKKETAYGKSK